MKVALLLLALVACKIEHTPPPIARGKCVVDEWSEARPTRQTCDYAGSVWFCRTSFGDTVCVREGELPAERAP